MQLMPVLAEYYATRAELAHILRYIGLCLVHNQNSVN